MIQDRHEFPPTRPDALEFEITDLGEARAALDELPAGIGAMPMADPAYWASRRRRPEPSDRALTGPAIDWLLSLPPEVRPLQTGERFPRIVNALAQAWGTPPRREAVLRELLHDTRPRRIGFPLRVRRELEALRVAHRLDSR
ncbi:MAG: hypothetical protein KGI35_10275 [Burkholderiales bacterium]|nr:hypothetical protein [Burkholderiales bacterium]MDE2395555.1 hypothetical protein [Burkholderiales bacterium]